MIAWSLFLFNMEITGIVVEGLCLAYEFNYIKNNNNWRLLSISLITLTFSYLLLTLGNLLAIYPLMIPFLLVNSLNTSLVNEACCKMKSSTILPIYYVITTTMLVFTVTALLIPESPMSEYKTNLYTLIVLIFIPTFMELGLCLLRRTSLLNLPAKNLYN